MNGQQPNHLPGYNMPEQMLDPQYSRMMNQQLQQSPGMSAYNQNFYPQNYMQQQIQPQTMMPNVHQMQSVSQTPPMASQHYYQFQMPLTQNQTPHMQSQPPQMQQYYQQSQQMHLPAQQTPEPQMHMQHMTQTQVHSYPIQPERPPHYYEQTQQQNYQFEQQTPQAHHQYQHQPQQYMTQQPQISQSPQIQKQQLHIPQQTAQKKISPQKDLENSATHNEKIRKQRLEEEKQKEMEREKRESKRIQEELQTKQKEANRYAHDVQERLNQFKYPITFATCHVTTNLAKLLPVPQENIQATASLHCYDPETFVQVLNTDVDHELIDYMSNLLQASFDEVRTLQTKYNDSEANIYDGDNLPTLMKNIHLNSPYSFHIQSEFDDLTNDPDLERHFQAIADEVVSGGVVGDLLQLDDVAIDNLPSTSTANIAPTQLVLPESSAVSGIMKNRSEELRKQMVSLGKQPKGKGSTMPRRKRDMVEELYDSLTPLYDISSPDRRSRRRNRGDDKFPSASDEENSQAETETTAKFFQKAKPKKKEEDVRRPATPTEVMRQRDLEWMARQKERQDKLRRRQEQAEAEGWNESRPVEESRLKVENLMEQIFDQIGGFDVLNNADKSAFQDFLVDRPVLEELRQEVAKLKILRKLYKVDNDHLAKLIQMLEKNMLEVVNSEGSLLCIEILNNDDIGNETARELIHERLIRAAEAGSVALLIMTSHKMSKHVLIEDTVERAAQICKQLLKHVIYPAADSIVRNARGKKSEEKVKRKKNVGESFTSWVQHIYIRVVEMIECFSELVRFQVLNEVIVAQLCSMVTAPFFVDGIGEVHVASIQLLSVIFRRYENLRYGIIQELLISIHQIPSPKNPKNCYRLSNIESVHNFTVLILQLIQSAIVIPVKRRGEDGEDEKPTDEDDSAISSCFSEAKKYSVMFLKGFLMKCTAKSEEDYRRRFEQFLQDLLAAIYRPEWPVVELILTYLGNLLVYMFRDKNLEMSLRTACLDYLGTIAAKLKKDRVAAEKDAGSDEKSRFDLVVKGILYEETNDPTMVLDEINIDELSSTEKMQKLQQALIDYLIATKSDNDVSAEYAVSFYAGEWYKETIEDLKISQERHKARSAEGLDSREQRKEDKRLRKILERSDGMKEFLIRLADKKSLKKRSHYVAKTGNFLIHADALWTVKYLTSKKDFAHSFESYLKYIVHEIQSEQAVGLRTKAMRCLTQIIEADHQVLAMPEVYNAVNARMMDMNVAVREATIELLGKYLISRPDLFNSYYSILNDRIMDTGVAVRKRVIRIFREYVDKMPDSEKVPEILSKIIRRVSDEEGVKKLALDTLVNLWFTPMNERDPQLTKKVVTLVDAVSYSTKDSKAEHIENLFTTILKKDDVDRNILIAARQIVDSLVNYVLELNASMAGDNDDDLSIEQKTEREKKNQTRLLSSLTTLSIISKVRPEIMVRHSAVFLPYLSMSTQTPTEVQVLNQVINMLERIVPLMDHPSEDFLIGLDERLCAIIRDKGMLLVQSAISCLGGVCKKWTRLRTKVQSVFMQYITFLNEIKTAMNDDINCAIPTGKKPTLLRCLFSVGLLVRYFDFDFIIDGNIPEPNDMQLKRKVGVYPEAIFSILFFFARSAISDINQKSVTSLGHVCAEYPEFFEKMELRHMYQHLLSTTDDTFLQRKIEVLKNLFLFLAAEEERMIKAGEEYRRLKDIGELEDDLSATDTRGSLNAAIIQIFWKHVLTSYLHINDNVRIAVSQIVHSTMSQGLMTPGDSLPAMIAMTTDPLPAIRNKIEISVREVDAKYSLMLSSKALNGIRWAFEIQKRLAAGKHGTIVRGFRASEHCSSAALDDFGLPKTSAEAIAMLNVLYNCLRSNRQHRRSFMHQVVRMLAGDSRESISLEEMLFIADNLATFPYQVMDEPLYLIHTADTIVTISGQNVLSRIKELLKPKHPGELLDEEDEFKSANLYRRLPDDRTGIYELMKGSQACFLLLYLKTYLKQLYRLSDAKVASYSPSESAKITEKPITRQAISIFRPDYTLRELRPEAIQERDSAVGDIKLCELISYFRDMFYSLDLHNESDGENEKELNETAEIEPMAKKRRVVDEDDDDY